ncbi:uncharacterized protein LOC107430153 isoform X2 [Ziziphus jujuba]|uniref:Uncharacterized protein LOC107430153 isoform X2 n=1 Tax=Ziziphus jujuba TaxID=326968 RepID=A0ABM4AC10_ZIZJJ|nr:uncharacterized protein LOC107430153 isoform X2 [Ziziphus jujuba]
MEKRSRDEKIGSGGPLHSHNRAPTGPPASSGRPFPNHPHPPPPPPPQSRAPPPSIPRPRFEPVDREKTCPLLLRVFTKLGGHHSEEDFAVRGKEPKDEVQIYTWKDATLRELTDLFLVRSKRLLLRQGEEMQNCHLLLYTLINGVDLC